MKPRAILFATSEMAPWVKTGGLGDVAAALPEALRQAGLEPRLLGGRMGLVAATCSGPMLSIEAHHASALAGAATLNGDLNVGVLLHELLGSSFAEGLKRRGADGGDGAGERLRLGLVFNLGQLFNRLRRPVCGALAAGRAFGMPTTLLIDANGCELGHIAGPAEWASEDALKLIRAALGT